MEKVGFYYEVSVQVNYSLEDVANLERCSRSHYDYKCKAASECGGLIYGMRTRVIFSDPSATHATAFFSIQELDFLCKVTEGISGGPPFSEETLALQDFLSQALKNALREENLLNTAFFNRGAR